MSTKDKKRNSFMLIILGFSLIILAVSIFYSMSSKISDKEKEEIQKSAVSLVERNFDTVTYFKIAQLPYAEQYNAEEYQDGTLPCSTSIFKNYDELSKFVKNTYIPSSAEIILGSTVNGKPRYFDKNGVLCKTVAPADTSYDKDFSSYSVSLEKIRKTSCDIKVTLKTKSTGENVILNLSMTKKNGKWYLNEMVY